MRVARSFALGVMAAACVLGRSGLAAGDANELVPDAAGAAGSGAAAAAAMEGARAAPDFETAMDELVQRGEAGDAAAQWSLGMRYRFGVGVDANLDTAREWLKRAAEADHAEACRAYAWTCAAKGQDKKAVAEAARWMARAAELGNVDAMAEEADFATLTTSIPSFAKKLRVAATKGSIAARSRYAAMVLAGMANSGSKAEALRFLREAADAGSAVAAEHAGAALHSGMLGTTDPEQAISYWRQAAVYGRPNAQYYLASELREQTGDRRVFSREGMRWLIQASEQNHAGSLSRLSRMYLRGDGVPKDVTKAIELIERMGGIGAMYDGVVVGRLYEEGRELPRDMATALAWYRKGAKFGSTEAQSALARLLSSGDGVERDLVEAYMWANIAAADGGPEQVAQREAIARILSPAETQSGQARASKFKPMSRMSAAAGLKVAPPEFLTADGVVTGFFVSSDGYLVTSSLLLTNARRVRVLVDGKPLDAVIVRLDAGPDSEIALLKIVATTTPVRVAAKTGFESGTLRACSFPSPWGEWKTPLAREVEVEGAANAGVALLKLDAHAGDSGGAVLNEDGQLVGVMTNRVPLMGQALPDAIAHVLEDTISTVTPTLGIDRTSPLLKGVDLDGVLPTDPKAIAPFVVVMIEL